MKAVVANTDRGWFDFLREKAKGGPLDEANFWRPKDTRRFGRLGPGGPFFLRLKTPVNAIAGFGFFAHWVTLPVRSAWGQFFWRNGAADLETFLSRIGSFRGSRPSVDGPGAPPLGCILLSHVHFLDEADWIPWGQAQDWAKNIVQDKTYDLTAGPGSALQALLDRVNGHGVPELGQEFRLVAGDHRKWRRQRVVAREGQGTFRQALIGAYDGRCAVTGERTLPALEAAHIQSYMGTASNHIQNGLLLRADLHNLFDEGLVTVTPDRHLLVSPAIRDLYENGRDYYALDGDELRPPGLAQATPSPEALSWHNEEIFRDAG